MLPTLFLGRIEGFLYYNKEIITKKFNTMKRKIFCFFVVAFSLMPLCVFSAQQREKKSNVCSSIAVNGVPEQQMCCKEFNNLQAWVLGRSWAGKFNALPDVATNLYEFRSQYNKNKEQWDAAFHWLATQDIQHIQPGRHAIEGTTLVASVEDSENQPLAKRGTESHIKHVDLMYVVKGTERFGLLDHASSKLVKDLPERDFKGYEYDLAKAYFFDSTPERFIVFFPSDWHIAKVKTDKADQTIRVIVIKLDYIQ